MSALNEYLDGFSERAKSVGLFGAVDTFLKGLMRQSLVDSGIPLV
jgi:hypothetical protein